MRGLIRIGALFIFVLFSITPLGAATIHVPADQPTIQAGIDAAGSGDVVLVADGTWTGPGNRELDFDGRAISVASANGPGNCVIDCGGDQYDGFIMDGGEGPGSVVRGFTIRNGHFGIETASTSPVITGNVITGCAGGIHASTGSQLITGNTISGCRMSGISGGFFYNTGYSWEPVITGNTITGNGGDGISFYSEYGFAHVEISTNIIEGNGGQGIGVGGHISITVTGNTISGNSGGGVRAAGGETAATVEGNVITGNSAERGAGVYMTGGELRNNLIQDNHASLEGGGIYTHYFTSTITNCTVVGNSAGSRGGGIHLNGGIDLLVASCIIRGNQAPVAAEFFAGNNDPNHRSELRVRYSNIGGGVDGIVLGSGWDQVHLGPGLIDADPLFAAGPNGDHYLSQVAAGQAVDSPSVDSGDPGEVITGTTRTDEVQDTGVEDQGYHYHGYAANCDLDGSGRVDGRDLAILAWAFGSYIGDWRYSSTADIDGSGTVDGEDMALLAAYFGSGA